MSHSNQSGHYQWSRLERSSVTAGVMLNVCHQLVISCTEVNSCQSQRTNFNAVFCSSLTEQT